MVPCVLVGAAAVVGDEVDLLLLAGSVVVGLGPFQKVDVTRVEVVATAGGVTRTVLHALVEVVVEAIRVVQVFISSLVYALVEV